MKKKIAVCLIVPLLFVMAAYAAGMKQQVVMEIKGMTCEVCTIAVKKALTGVQGVKIVRVSFDEKKAWVTVDKSVTDEMLIEAIRQAGEYEGKVIERKSTK